MRKRLAGITACRPLRVAPFIAIRLQGASFPFVAKTVWSFGVRRNFYILILAGILIVVLFNLPGSTSARMNNFLRDAIMPLSRPMAHLLASGRGLFQDEPQTANHIQLLAEITQLRLELRQAQGLELENRALRKMLGLSAHVGRRLIAAEIIARDGNAGWQTARLNKGLADGIALDMAAPIEVPRDVMQSLLDYSWPGNVRELENVLTQAVLRSSGQVLTLDFWSAASPSNTVERELKSLADIEKEHIEWVLAEVGGHLGKACEVLGITRPTLRKKIEDYVITVPLH